MGGIALLATIKLILTNFLVIRFFHHRAGVSLLSLHIFPTYLPLCLSSMVDTLFFCCCCPNSGVLVQLSISRSYCRAAAAPLAAPASSVPLPPLRWSLRRTLRASLNCSSAVHSGMLPAAVVAPTVAVPSRDLFRMVGDALPIPEQFWEAVSTVDIAFFECFRFNK